MALVQAGAVIGCPDPEWGEILCAFVVLRDGSDAEIADLDRHCLESIARFKRPKRYELISALPKNHYGKVLKRDLRERLAGSGSEGR